MRRQDDGRTSPRWRGVLEARWRARLDEVTELSLAYHAAADVTAGVEGPRARVLLHRATEARQRLADTEDALGKMVTGDFGRCEHCGVSIAEVLLAAAPESRYCGGCTGDMTAGDMTAGDMTDGDTRAGGMECCDVAAGGSTAGATAAVPAAASAATTVLASIGRGITGTGAGRR